MRPAQRELRIGRMLAEYWLEGEFSTCALLLEYLDISCYQGSDYPEKRNQAGLSRGMSSRGAFSAKAGI